MRKQLFVSILACSALCAISSTALCADSMRQAVVGLHNTLRSMHAAPPLVWDQSLADYARKYGKQCRFEHSLGPYGENLAAGYATPEQALLDWYDEEIYYDYDNPGFSHKTGHFTQVIWVGTTAVGCALVTCNGKHGTPGEYLICEYNPPGNIDDAQYFAENVLPPTNPKHSHS